jgi:poly(3-hydroxybutyrate) depolymerase
MKVTLLFASVLVGCTSTDVTAFDASIPQDSQIAAPQGDAARNIDGALDVDGGSRSWPGDLARCSDRARAGLQEGQNTDFVAAGQNRSFYFRSPAGLATPRPLLFVFHGTGLSGERAFADYELSAFVEEGYLVVAPDSAGNGDFWPVWDSAVFPGSPPRLNADLELFDALLSCVSAHFEVDASRIFVGGHSAGGAMTHYMLGHRSNVLAGGLAASGAFDLSQDMPPGPVRPVTALITWGGSNDFYSGAAGSSSLQNFSYVEQSAVASQFWASQPGSHQLHCVGPEVGHVWLAGMSGWFARVLREHPKDAVAPGWTLPPLPVGVGHTCSTDAAVYEPPVQVDCPVSSTTGCREYCQLLGECVVENGTLGPALASALSGYGFAAGNNVCSGCVARCESDATSTGSQTALACIEAASSTLTCGPGFQGVPGLAAIASCCDGSTSEVCARFCGELEGVSGIERVLPGCFPR